MSGSTFSANSANNSAGIGGAIANSGTLTVTNSTFSDNSARGGIGSGGAIFSGSGIDSNSPSGLYNYPLTVTNSTFSGNSASGVSFGGGGICFDESPGPGLAPGTMMVSDSIFSGNSGGGIVNASFYSNTAAASYNVFSNNGSEGDCIGCTSNTNAIDADPKLAPLGNYGGPTPTMLPLPGSAAICAGSTALVPTGLTTDQRGFPRLNSTHTGNPCVDAGAVQTNYQSVQFTNAASGYSAVVNQVLNPAPIVSVTENGQNIGGVPVTLTFSGTGKASGLGPVTTTAGTGATFGSLSVDTVGSDTLAATLQITPSYTLTTNPPAKLDITQTKASQTINFTPPTSPVTYGVSPITLVATATSGLSVTFTVQSGPAKVSGNILTITDAGTIVIAANQAGNSTYAAATQVTQSITVTPQATSLTLTSSATTIAAGQTLALTAKVAAASSGTPSGTVTFLDGATKLSTATLANGAASYSTATLAIGSHTLTAMYSGDSNYAASSSSAGGDVVIVSAA